jgi:hypothetical protein
VEHVVRKGGMRNTRHILIGNPEGKGQLHPKRRWEGNVRMDLVEIM